MLLCPSPPRLLKMARLKTLSKELHKPENASPYLGHGRSRLGYVEPEPGKAFLFYTKLFLVELTQCLPGDRAALGTAGVCMVL